MAGIVGYGAFVPRKRIKSEEIARQWGKDPATIERGLLLKEKTVPGIDEDTITISVEAARYALDRCGIDPARIGAVYIGSESHPYAVKPSGTVVAEALGIVPEVHVADFEFACKAGTEAMFVALSLVEAGNVEYALGIGADTSQGAPNDALEFSASAGGAAYIFGKTDLMVDVLDTYSYTTDTPDFWRREGEFYPQHGGRFTGEPAYFKHVLSATKRDAGQVRTQTQGLPIRRLSHAQWQVPSRGGEEARFHQRTNGDRLGRQHHGQHLLGLFANGPSGDPGRGRAR